MPPMRLTLISTQTSPADDRQISSFALLCNALAARGHRVRAICPPSCGEWLAPGVTHVRWRCGGPAWNPLAVARLALAVLESRPEMLHACDDKAAWMLQKAAGQGLVACPKVASLVQNASHAQGYDAVVAVLPAVAARLAATGPNTPVTLVFPATPAVALDESGGQSLRAQECVPDGAVVALVSVDMNAPGHLGQLVEMWPRVGHAELWVVGAGLAAQALVAQAREAGCLIEGNYDRSGQVNGVRWLGARTDWPALLAACDLVILPARAPGQTKILAQALLAGKPVVAASHGWAAQILPPEHSVPADCPAALSEALGVALADVPFARQMQADAFAKARREWVPEAMAAAVEEVYGRVMAGENRGG